MKLYQVHIVGDFLMRIGRPHPVTDHKSFCYVLYNSKDLEVIDDMIEFCQDNNIEMERRSILRFDLIFPNQESLLIFKMKYI